MKEQIKSILITVGDTTQISKLISVSGGMISKAWKAETGKQAYFIKISEADDAPKMFEKETEGLQALKATQSLPVPEVYKHGQLENQRSYLVMEWIEGKSEDDTAERLGNGLARLHETTAERYGFNSDNFLGRHAQPNGWTDNWTSFLRDRRLGHQMKLAVDRNMMTGPRRSRMERLLERLGEWIPAHGRPSLLHGDLWSGNWLQGSAGQPYLIDPAVFYGEAEFELAFTELFGGFPPRFYEAYYEVRPARDGYEDRKPFYQLHYLLVHLNHFGERYGPNVDEVLKKYVG